MKKRNIILCAAAIAVIAAAVGVIVWKGSVNGGQNGADSQNRAQAGAAGGPSGNGAGGSSGKMAGGMAGGPGEIKQAVQSTVVQASEPKTGSI